MGVDRPFSVLLLLVLLAGTVSAISPGFESNFLVSESGSMILNAGELSDAYLLTIEKDLTTQSVLPIIGLERSEQRVRINYDAPARPSKVRFTSDGVSVVALPQSFIVQFDEPPALAEEQQKTQAAPQTESQRSQRTATLTRTTKSEAPKQDIRQRREQVRQGQDEVLSRISSELSQARGILRVQSSLIPRRRYTDVLNGVALDLTPEQAMQVRKTRGVKRVEPDREMRIQLQDSVNQAEASTVWNLDANGEDCSLTGLPCIRGQNVTIAILDTGIDYTHPDFGSCSVSTFTSGNCEKVTGGYDFVNSDSNPMDDQGHGTHVASIAAGKADDGDDVYEPGNDEYWGVAPDATLTAYKVLDYTGSGYTSDIIAAIDQAVQDGADIISMSLGGSGDPDDSLSQATDTAVDAGVLVVVAAGNSGPSQQTIGSPGTARKALTVGAVDRYDDMASFSSRGPVVWEGGVLVKPEIVAPGVSICAAQHANAYDSESCGSGRVALSGTSMATPMVSGLAALTFQRFNLSAEDTRALIINTADDLGFRRVAQGTGRINASTMLDAEIVVTGDLNFGIIQSGLSLTTDITITNIGDNPRTVQLAVTTAEGLEGGSLDGVSINDSQVVLSPDESASVAVIVNVSASAGGTFTGFVEANTSLRAYRIPYSFASYATLNLTVLGEHYPNFYVFDNTTQNLYSQSQFFGFIGNTTTLQVTGGNYTVIAVSDFVIPDRPAKYFETEQYILAKTVEVPVGEVTDIVFDLSEYDVFTLNTTGVDGDRLVLDEWLYGFAAYVRDVGFCYGLSQGACEARRGCYYDDFCYDQAVVTTFSSDSVGNQRVRLSERPLNNLTTDIIFKYTGGPE